MRTLFLLVLALNLHAQVDFDKHLDISKDEYRARREALRQKIEAPIVIMGGMMRNRINDTEYEFRQESNFYYLTGFSEPGAYLVMAREPFPYEGQMIRELLFVLEDNPRSRTYLGKRIGPERAMSEYGLEKAVLVAEGNIFRGEHKSHFEAFMKDFVKKQPKFHLMTPIVNFNEFGNPNPDFYESYKAGLLSALKPSGLDQASSELQKVEVLPQEPLWAALTELRSIKSETERKMLQRAVDVTLSGHGESLKIAKDVAYEYQVEAAVEFAFRYNGAAAQGYNSIVGCGANGTILHYEANGDAIDHGQMFVLDAGAEYRNYTADITRSFPSGGTFSKQQAEIYQIVLDAQRAGEKQFRAGNTYSHVLAAIKEVQYAGLQKLGLIQVPVTKIAPKALKGMAAMTYAAAADIVHDGKVLVPKYGGFRGVDLSVLNQDQELEVFDERQFVQLCPHGWGHSVGLDVHDPAPREFKVGMIWTIEPGIYISDRVDFPIDKAYMNIGVRIEDMYLITENGNVCMSKALPREIHELEAFMKEKSHLLLREHKH